MSETKFKGAIFDLDGVIVDSVPLHFKAWERTFSDYGKDFTFADYKEKVDGIPSKSGAKAILGAISDEELKEVEIKKQDYYLEYLHKQGVKVHQDTLGLIQELKSNQIKLGAISSSKVCKDVLDKTGMLNMFEVVIGGNDINKGKPDPQIFLLAAREMGLRKEECIVFEDAVLGVKAGARGRFLTIGVDRYNNPERLKEADLVVADLSEVDFNSLNLLIENNNQKGGLRDE